MKSAVVGILLAVLLAVTPPCRAEAAKALTNADVVQMVKAGIPESTILLSVQSAPAEFMAAPADLVELKKAGVTPAVMDAMVARANSAARPSAASSASGEQAAASDRPSGKTIKVFIPDEWPTADKELFRDCVDEVNVQRRQDGQTELEAISQGAKVRQAWGRAALGALATMAIAVTPVGGAAALGGNVSDGAMAKESYAQSRVTECMAEHRGADAQQEAMENMQQMQRQLQPGQPAAPGATTSQ